MSESKAKEKRREDMNVEEFTKQMLSIFDDAITATEDRPKEDTFAVLRDQHTNILEEFHALKESAEKLLKDNLKLYELRNSSMEVIEMLTKELAKHEPIAPDTTKDVN